MALNYDTEIELLFPAPLFDDPICALALKKVGIEKEAAGNKVMLFTDPRTVAALNAADDKIKEIFRKSGFGLVLYGWSRQAKSDFLIETLRGLASKYHDDKALSCAVFDLLRYVQNGVMGRLDPNPFAAPCVAGSTEPFDLARALEVIVSPEQMNKPKASEQARTRSFFKFW